MCLQNVTTELVSIAEAMLRGEMCLIAGCRKICSLRQKLNDPEKAVFMLFRAIDSETDHYPLGKVRRKCDPEYLRQMDAEMARYVSEACEDILDGCHEIIRTYNRASNKAP